MKNPLTIATFSLVGITFILVVITTIYVIFTGKMARRMKEQIDLQNKEFNMRVTPHYDMPKLELCQTSGTKIKLRPRIFNAGLSPFRLDLVSLTFLNRDDANKSWAEPLWINKYIFPKNEVLPRSNRFRLF